ncbi:MAG: RHS repeat protein, partial [Candidatus Omnitrophica bacterium]|nr:RHS repeat protein [Candidatus Omnitrophota bacterium]
VYTNGVTGAVTRYNYDSLFRVTRTEDALGNVTTYTYGTTGNGPETIRDARGNITRFEYNSLGNVVRKTDPLAHVTRYEYALINDEVRLIFVEGPDGTGRYMEYDANGNMTQVISGARPIRDGNGNLTGYYPTSTLTLSSYDTFGNLVSTSDYFGLRASYSYDSFGNLISSRDALGNETVREYDLLNRLIRIRNPQGRETVMNYAGAGSNLSSVTTDGITVRHRYDSRDRLIETEDALGHITQFNYDGNTGRIIETREVGDPENSLDDIVATFQYDALGNMISSAGPLGGATHFFYDSLNRLTRVVAPEIDTQISVEGIPAYITDAGRNVRFRVLVADDSQMATLRYRLRGESSWIQSAYTSEWQTLLIPRGDGAKQIDIEVMDETGNWGSFTAETILDSKGPEQLSIQIDGGEQYTNSREVNLTLAAEDSGSGVEMMSFYLGEGTYTPWEPFSTSKTVTLTPGDGVKQIFFRTLDRLGNESEIISASITLDTQPPQIEMITQSVPQQTSESYIVLSYYLDNVPKLKRFDLTEDWNHIQIVERDEAGNEAKGPDWWILGPPRIVLNGGNLYTSSNFPTMEITSAGGIRRVDYTVNPRDSGGGFTRTIDYSSQMPTTVQISLELPNRNQLVDIGATVYFLNGSKGFQNFLVMDTTPPTGDMVINEGINTHNTEITLTLTAEDLSGVESMEFSLDDGRTWTEKEPFGSQKTLTLSDGNGPRKVICRLTDRVGLTSILEDSIYLGIPFQAWVLLKDGESVTNKRTVPLRLTTQAAPFFAVTRMDYSIDDGQTWAGPFAPQSEYLISFSNEPGIKTVLVRLWDNVGNMMTLSEDIEYDPTLPDPGSSYSIPMPIYLQSDVYVYESQYRPEIYVRERTEDTFVTGGLGYIIKLLLNGLEVDRNSTLTLSPGKNDIRVQFWDSEGKKRDLSWNVFYDTFIDRGAFTDFDAYGNKVWKRTAGGDEIRYEYADDGRLARTIDAGGEQAQYTYDASGNLASVTDASGTTEYTRDPAGRITRMMNASRITFYTYNSAGRIDSITKDGATVRYNYNSQNLLVSTEEPSGRTTFVYDGSGRIQSIAKPDGVRITYFYDASGRVIREDDSARGRTLYTYDARGNRATKDFEPPVITPDNLRVQTQYLYGYSFGRENDARLLETRSKKFEAPADNYQSVDSFQLKENGVNYLYANQEFSAALDFDLYYDSTDDGSGQQRANWPRISPGWNAMPYQIEFPEAKANVTLGGLTQYTYPSLTVRDRKNGRALHFTLSELSQNWVGQISSVYTVEDGSLPYTLHYFTKFELLFGQGESASFTERGELASLAYSNSSQNVSYLSSTGSGFVRDPADPNGGISLMGEMGLSYIGPDWNIRFGYNSQGRLSDIYGGLGDKHKQLFYNSSGDLSSVRDAVTGKEIFFFYDDQRRLIRKTDSDGQVLFDHRYNVLNRPLGREVSSGKEEFVYDASGNLVQKRVTDNSHFDHVEYMEYDTENHLTRWFDGSKNVEFEYDGAGNRVSRRVNGELTQYAPDASRAVLPVYAMEAEEITGLVFRDGRYYDPSFGHFISA